MQWLERTSVRIRLLKWQAVEKQMIRLHISSVVADEFNRKTRGKCAHLVWRLFHLLLLTRTPPIKSSANRYNHDVTGG